MFPVPTHLPRSPLGPNGDGSSGTTDPALELVEPLLKDSTSSFSLHQVQSIREQLEQAITSNKKRSHDQLIDNFPTVSSHIQLGTSLRADYSALQTTLESLEREIDPSHTEVSFLPPTLDLLDRHFTAVNNKAKAEQHVSALSALKTYTERLQKLENAIWAGRGADEWVITDLTTDGYQVQQGLEILEGTRTYDLVKERSGLFKSMVIEQITDAFSQAVSFSSKEAEAVTISVQTKTTLQIPRIAQPTRTDPTNTPSKPPPYSVSHIYDTLSAFSTLSSTLTSLKNRLLRDVLPLLVDPNYKATSKSESNTSSFRLERSDTTRKPSAILHDVSTFLTFLHDTVLSECSHPEVRSSWASIHSAVMQTTLDKVILPAMPTSLSTVPTWLDLVRSAVEIEEAQGKSEEIVKRFFDHTAGEAWANQRRKRIAEEVRRLVLGGWGGWEAKEAEREKEISMVVEVEVDELEPIESTELAKPTEKVESKETDAFGWGFDDSPKAEMKEDPLVEGDGWDFDDSPQAGPSSPRKENNGHNEEAADGWDFDDPIETPPVEQPKPILAKPAREAKRLGKKVAKVKAVQEDDPWGSGSESMPSTSAAPEPETATDGWGWDEPESEPATAPEPVKPVVAEEQVKRKVLKEEKRLIRETFLVSRACDKVVDIAERVLRESKEVGASNFSSASFTLAPNILLSSATDVFDLYRALLPSHYAPQIRDVPTISMQVHNDALHLAARVDELSKLYPEWTASGDVITRLHGLADHIFENQLEAQKEGLMETIDQARGFALGTDVGLKNAEKAISGVVHNIETLSKIVLPTTTYLTVLGYLLDESVYRITCDILDLMDITETESERMNNVLQPIRNLEQLFILESGQPSTVVSHVPHWLKFCYISELLQANLVDILYLFDSGALIDFTTEELVSLIRALFADSEKRDNAIERIEKGGQATDV